MAAAAAAAVSSITRASPVVSIKTIDTYLLNQRLVTVCVALGVSKQGRSNGEEACG